MVEILPDLETSEDYSGVRKLAIRGVAAALNALRSVSALNIYKLEEVNPAEADMQMIHLVQEELGEIGRF